MRFRAALKGWVAPHSTPVRGDKRRIHIVAIIYLSFLAALQLCTACGYYTCASLPQVNWSDPPAIVYGAVLSSAQLNATADNAGTFEYLPSIGTLLPAGRHVLSVRFTPADRSRYSPVTKSVNLAVEKASPVISWPSPPAMPAGTPLTSSQLHPLF